MRHPISSTVVWKLGEDDDRLCTGRDDHWIRARIEVARDAVVVEEVPAVVVPAFGDYFFKLSIAGPPRVLLE